MLRVPNQVVEAITAIEKGNFKRVVTNANIARDDKLLTGVTQKLADEGIEFYDVFKASGKQ